MRFSVDTPIDSGGGSSTLDGVTAATGSVTIDNGNNPIGWNWTQTTASQTGFAIGETTASTSGAGSQVLHKIGTLAASTADPLQVQTRGVDTIRISQTGAVTITALNGTTGGGTTGSAVSITGGQGASTSAGGPINITSGNGGSTSGASGDLVMRSGNTTNGGTGNIAITSGTPTTGNSGAIDIYSAWTANGDTGDLNISVGSVSEASGRAGTLNLSGGSSRTTQVGYSGGIVLTGGDSGAGTATSVDGGPIVLTAGSGSATTTGGVGGAIAIRAGAGGLAAAGGELSLTAGLGGVTGNGGDLSIIAGTSGITSGTGGTLYMYGGESQTSLGGNVYLYAGYSDTSDGGITIIGGGYGSGGNGGNLVLTGGSSDSGVGGDIVFMTSPTDTPIERARFLVGGALSFGSSGTNTGTSGQVLTSTGGTTPPTWQAPSGALNAIPATSGDVSGPSSSTLNAGATVALGNLMYLGSASKWLLTDADAEATCKGMLALALASSTDTNPVLVALSGSFVKNTGWSWTVGDIIYASGTPGALTTTAPTGSGAVVRIVGYATATNAIYFLPDPTYIVLA